jgi:hypothetical protein
MPFVDTFRPVNSGVRHAPHKIGSLVLGGAAQETDAGSKAFDDGRSNNSLNASGMSPDVIREIEGFPQCLPPL